MSSKRVIFHEFTNKYKLNIVDQLYREHGWEPVFMSGTSPDESIYEWIKNKHESCILQDALKLRQGIFDYTKIGDPVPIDTEILNSVSKYLQNSLSIVNDSTGWNFSFEERKRFYYDMLKYWNTVIHRTKPDIFVSFYQPQNATCNWLYLLCKHYYKIDVLFLDPVSLLNSNYHLVGISLDELYAPFLDLYKSDKVFEPGVDSKQYLSSLRSDEPEMPQYIVNDHKKFDKYSGGIRYKELIKILLLTFINGYGFHKNLDWKKNRKPIHLPASRMNILEYFIFIEKIRKKSRNLKKYYEPLCVNPDYRAKYLYFAASYQPEANTATNAGPYETFFLALDILSAAIPADWVIYYKENPTTFRSSPSNMGALRRDRYYYEKVNSYKNVELVSQDISTFKLIDNAQVVATVSGTVAWEAAVRGKPAMSFGSAWYLGCKSIFWIKTLKDAYSAMEKILNGYAPDQEDIDRYAASIEIIATKGMVHRDFYSKIENCSDPANEMTRIANALYKAYERHYSS